MQQPDLVKLGDLVAEYFNKNELVDLCRRLRIEYENLVGETRNLKAHELTFYCHRHGMVPVLLQKCRELRPHVEWDSVMTVAAPQPPQEQLGSVDNPFPQSSVPHVPGMFWMAYPNYWYGPFQGFFIMWLPMGGFQIWNPYYGIVPFPDPYRSVQRNVWLRLPNSPFNIYVDGSVNGHVFGQYAP